MKSVATAAVVLALVTGCVESPTAQPRSTSASEAQPEPAVRDTPLPVPTPSADVDDAATIGREQARAASLRLRVTGPRLFGASVGSGFAIDTDTVVTNAHVIATGEHVEMTSWDGRELDATVDHVARRHDLAVLATRPRVPVEPLQLADAAPQPGQSVIVVGFPGGGRITVEDDARVVDMVDASRYRPAFGADHIPDRVVRIDADSVEPGSSGGPVLDTSGALVGVIFAIDREGRALAVPVSTLRTWLDQLRSQRHAA